MSTSTRARATSATIDEADAIDMISSLTEDLMAYADGRPVNKKTRAVLDEMILDYIDGELDSEVARDVEALMRSFPSVARLVADKTEKTHIQNRLSMLYDGELDPKASANIRCMIEDDPYAAKLARRIRQGGDYLRVLLQPIPGQHVDKTGITAIKAETLGESDVAPTIARFSTLFAYATGMTIDKEIQGLLDGMIIRYIDGTLDRLSTLGLEASMRLSSSVARLVADKSGGQSNLSGSTPILRHRTKQTRAACSAQSRSRHFESL